jgi:hypothetical protein
MVLHASMRVTCVSIFTCDAALFGQSVQGLTSMEHNSETLESETCDSSPKRALSCLLRANRQYRTVSFNECYETKSRQTFIVFRANSRLNVKQARLCSLMMAIMSCRG